MNSSLPALLDCYTRLVLAVTDDDNKDPLWNRFYRIQMTSWILTRKHFNFVMEDALDAYDKIVESWNELENYMNHCLLPVRNFDSVFKMVKVPFAVTEDTITQNDNNDFLVGQNGAFSEPFYFGWPK